jgi:hypothetical protein
MSDLALALSAIAFGLAAAAVAISILDRWLLRRELAQAQAEWFWSTEWREWQETVAMPTVIDVGDRMAHRTCRDARTDGRHYLICQQCSWLVEEKDLLR